MEAIDELNKVLFKTLFDHRVAEQRQEIDHLREQIAIRDREFFIWREVWILHVEGNFANGVSKHDFGLPFQQSIQKVSILQVNTSKEDEETNKLLSDPQLQGIYISKYNPGALYESADYYECDENVKCQSDLTNHIHLQAYAVDLKQLLTMMKTIINSKAAPKRAQLSNFKVIVRSNHTGSLCESNGPQPGLIMGGTLFNA